MNNESMQPIELKLPVTGVTVVISSYVTIGQSRELQRILMQNSNLDITTGKMEGINPNSIYAMQDRGTELLVKEYIDKDGTHVPFSSDWLNNLPSQDGELIYNKVNEIVNHANLSDESKKN